jgi:hypothetical protein
MNNIPTAKVVQVVNTFLTSAEAKNVWLHGDFMKKLNDSVINAANNGQRRYLISNLLSSENIELIEQDLKTIFGYRTEWKSNGLYIIW